MRLALAISLLAVGCVEPDVLGQRAAVIYGEDDRREPHEAKSASHAEIARNQVAVRIVDWAVDLENPEAPVITYTRTLGVSENLCEGERFFDQIAPGSCSATLIDDKHILTAAHCVSDPDECDGSHYWVFGFYLLPDGTPAPLTRDSIYTCVGMTAISVAGDYAVVELDRPVMGRSPVSARLLAAGLESDAPITLVGFPNGVPAKVDSGGRVVQSEPSLFFTGTVDAFANSSGSGVFDAEGSLVGFLQRGAEDYVARGDCNTVNILDPSAPGAGEQMAYLDEALQDYCTVTGSTSTRLCNCDGPCVEPASTPDSGVPDAEPADGGLDAGALDAGGGSPDAGTDAGSAAPPAADSGCGVSGKREQTVPALFLFALFAVRSRKRYLKSSTRRSRVGAPRD